MTVQKRPLAISTRLSLIGCLVAVGLFTSGALAFATLSRVKVSGPIYRQIVLGKDLIADILPPPEYVIEAYLETTLTLNDPPSAPQRRARLQQLHKEYNDRYTYWKELEDFDPVNKQLIADESYTH